MFGMAVEKEAELTHREKSVAAITPFFGDGSERETVLNGYLFRVFVNGDHRAGEVSSQLPGGPTRLSILDGDGEPGMIFRLWDWRDRKLIHNADFYADIFDASGPQIRFDSATAKAFSIAVVIGASTVTRIAFDRFDDSIPNDIAAAEFPRPDANRRFLRRSRHAEAIDPGLGARRIMLMYRRVLGGRTFEVERCRADRNVVRLLSAKCLARREVYHSIPPQPGPLLWGEGEPIIRIRVRRSSPVATSTVPFSSMPWPRKTTPEY